MTHGKLMLFIWIGQCIFVYCVLMLLLKTNITMFKMTSIILLSGLLLILYLFYFLAINASLKKITFILSFVLNLITSIFQSLILFLFDWEFHQLEMLLIIFILTIVCLFGDLVNFLKRMDDFNQKFSYVDLFIKVLFEIIKFVMIILFYIYQTCTSLGIEIELSYCASILFVKILSIIFSSITGNVQKKSKNPTYQKTKKSLENKSKQQNAKKNYKKQDLNSSLDIHNQKNLQSESSVNISKAELLQQFENKSKFHFQNLRKVPQIDNIPSSITEIAEKLNNLDFVTGSSHLNINSFRNKIPNEPNFRQISMSPFNESTCVHQFLLDKLKFVGIGIFDNKKNLIKYNIEFSQMIMDLLKNVNLCDVDHNSIIKDWVYYFKKIILQSHQENSENVESFEYQAKNMSDELVNFMNLECDFSSILNNYVYFAWSEKKKYIVQIIKDEIMYAPATIVILQETAENFILTRNIEENLKEKIQANCLFEIQSYLNYMAIITNNLKDELPLEKYLSIKKQFKLILFIIRGKLELVSKMRPANDFKFDFQYFSIQKKINKIISYFHPFLLCLNCNVVVENSLDETANMFWWDKNYFQYVIVELLLSMLQIITKGGVVIQLYQDSSNKNTVSIRFNVISEDPDLTGKLQNIQSSITAINNLETNSCSNDNLGSIHLNKQSNNRTIHLFLESAEKNMSALILQFIQYNPGSNSTNNLDNNMIFMNQANSFLEESVIDPNLINLNHRTAIDNLDLDIEQGPCSCPFRILVIASESFNYFVLKITLNNILTRLNKKLVFLNADNQEIAFQLFSAYFYKNKCHSKRCLPIRIIIWNYIPEIKMDDWIYRTKKMCSNSFADAIHAFVWVNEKDIIPESQFEKWDGTLFKPLKSKNIMEMLKKCLLV